MLIQVNPLIREGEKIVVEPGDLIEVTIKGSGNAFYCLVCRVPEYGIQLINCISGETHDCTKYQEDESILINNDTPYYEYRKVQGTLYINKYI